MKAVDSDFFYYYRIVDVKIALNKKARPYVEPRLLRLPTARLYPLSTRETTLEAAMMPMPKSIVRIAISWLGEQKHPSTRMSMPTNSRITDVNAILYLILVKEPKQPQQTFRNPGKKTRRLLQSPRLPPRNTHTPPRKPHREETINRLKGIFSTRSVAGLVQFYPPQTHFQLLPKLSCFVPPQIVKVLSLGC